MIAHVPLFVHPRPQRVLVIGGGDGGTVREVLRHRAVERVVMVEIDAVVVEACRQFMPGVAAAMEDPRLELLIDDGIRYAAVARERFDVVIVDSSDPVGPAEGLFSRGFYGNISRCLAEDGILVTQAESPFYDGDVQRTLLGNQRPFFNRLHLYLYSNLTYPGGLWGFGFASKKYRPIEDLDARRIAGAALDTRYYREPIHRSAFVLPAFVLHRYRGLLDEIPD
jgi:spermidine synthase